jgi:hypothetical protein
VRHPVATLIAVLSLVVGLVGLARAGQTCVHPWAEVGEYIIEGDFRGRPERASAHLTNSCRVTIDLPGVFTGGPVTASGGCLQFSFKVRNVTETFLARWCGAYAIVPWQGRDMRATVYRVRRPEKQTW